MSENKRKMPKETLVKSLQNPESKQYKYCKNRGVNPEEIDWDSLLKSDLNGSENWERIKNKVEKDSESIEELREEVKDVGSKEKFMNDETDVEEFYQPMMDNIRGVANGYRDAFMIEADPGIGKTFQIEKMLSKIVGEEGYVKIQGVSTPLNFYKKLYRNRNKIIFVDDIEGLINKNKAKGILKQATWSAIGRDKKVSWDSSTGRLEENMKEFVFNGQIIMCFNEIPENDEIFNSLKDRCFFQEIRMGYEKKLKLIKEIAINTGKPSHLEVPKEERLKIYEWLKRHTSPSTKNFNIRTFDDCIDYWRMEKDGVASNSWKVNAAENLEFDENLERVYKLVKKVEEGEFETQKEAIKQFANETDKTMEAARRMFFRKKKKLG